MFATPRWLPHRGRVYTHEATVCYRSKLAPNPRQRLSASILCAGANCVHPPSWHDTTVHFFLRNEQVHIPGPDQSGREAILRIHTQRMHQAGRIDAPPPADVESKSGDGYSALVSSLAAATDGFTGAELAGLVRAAASYALERAVGGGGGSEAAAAGCRVTAEDFGRGLADVTRSKSSADVSAPGGAARRKAAGAWPPAAARPEREGGNTIGAAVGAAAEGGAREPDATAAAATSVSAAAVAAARSEGEIGGSLSPEVRQLLGAPTSARSP